jgi:hypothetical protein
MVRNNVVTLATVISEGTMDQRPTITAQVILAALAALQRIDDDLDALEGLPWTEKLRRDVAQRRAAYLAELQACEHQN